MIRDFGFVKQADTDPRKFYFKIEWKDLEGDLTSEKSPGQIRFSFVDMSTQDKTEQSTTPITIEPGTVPAGTTEGLFPEVLIVFLPPYPNQIKVIAQLVDSSGNESNRAWVIIEIQS